MYLIMVQLEAKLLKKCTDKPAFLKILLLSEKFIRQQYSTHIMASPFSFSSYFIIIQIIISLYFSISTGISIPACRTIQ